MHPGGAETNSQVYDRYDDELLARIDHLVGPWLLGRKCVGEHWLDDNGEVLLYKPDSELDMTNWVKIVMVSSKCEILRQEQYEEWNKTHHVMMKFPEWGRGFHKIGHALFMIDERLIDNDRTLLGEFVWLEPREATS